MTAAHWRRWTMTDLSTADWSTAVQQEDLNNREDEDQGQCSDDTCSRSVLARRLLDASQALLASMQRLSSRIQILRLQLARGGLVPREWLYGAATSVLPTLGIA